MLLARPWLTAAWVRRTLAPAERLDKQQSRQVSWHVVGQQVLDSPARVLPVLLSAPAPRWSLTGLLPLQRQKLAVQSCARSGEIKGCCGSEISVCPCLEGSQLCPSLSAVLQLALNPGSASGGGGTPSRWLPC